MKKLLNPNCSEVIARLPVKNITEGKNLLKSIGLDVIRFDPYLHMHILSPKGKEEKYNMIADPDNPNMPDFEHRSTFYLGKSDYNGEEGIYVQGHQHCQRQLYATIKKIQDKLGIDFYGHDGGGAFKELFEEWLKGGKVIDDYQKPLYDKIRKILEDEKIKNVVTNVFEVVDCVENKKHTAKEKYILLKKAYKEYLEQNKEELIKEKKEDERYKNIVKDATDQQIFEQITNQAMIFYLDPMFNILENKKLRERVLNNF